MRRLERHTREDGVLQEDAGEICDDGNSVLGDGFTGCRLDIVL